MRRLALAAAALGLAQTAAPAAASAQAGARTYALSGCDSRDLPGYASGVRLCASALATVSPNTGGGPAVTIVRYSNIVIDAFTPYSFTGGLNPRSYVFSPQLGIGPDVLDATPVFCLAVVCTGRGTQIGAELRSLTSYVPESFGFFVDYYAPDVLAGTPLGGTSAPTPVLRAALVTLTVGGAVAVVPEPATAALAGAGVLALAAWARRRGNA